VHDIGTFTFVVCASSNSIQNEWFLQTTKFLICRVCFNIHWKKKVGTGWSNYIDKAPVKIFDGNDKSAGLWVVLGKRPTVDERVQDLVSWTNVINISIET
jgi:hypothetical protein